MHIGPDVSAIVTGGASGLGLAAARAMRTAGVRVAILDRDEGAGTRAAREIGAEFCLADVESEESCVAAFACARLTNGQERILLTCAGIAPAGRIVARDRNTHVPRRLPTPEFERVIRLNLIGTLRCLAIAAEGMAMLAPLEDGERGAITLTSSIAATEGQVGQVAYAASKAGVSGIVLPAARDLAGEGIRVNAIMPGVFSTPMLQALPPSVAEGLSASVPYPRRAGHPEEFASLLLEILRNTYLNGQSLRIDGALRMGAR